MTGRNAVCPNCGQKNRFEQINFGGYLFCDNCGFSARQENFMKR